MKSCLLKLKLLLTIKKHLKNEPKRLLATQAYWLFEHILKNRSNIRLEIKSRHWLHCITGLQKRRFLQLVFRQFPQATPHCHPRKTMSPQRETPTSKALAPKVCTHCRWKLGELTGLSHRAYLQVIITFLLILYLIF